MNRSRFTAILSASAMSFLMAVPSASAQSFEDDTAFAIFKQLNQYREQQGLSPLNDDGRLIDAAEIYSGVMAQNNVLSHTADGKSFDQRAADHGYSCASAENVAQDNKTGSAEQVAQQIMTGWKNSQGHNENMLGNHAEIGVGVAVASDGVTVYATQKFGRGGC